jgi:hypothetical protein
MDSDLQLSYSEALEKIFLLRGFLVLFGLLK